MELIHKIKTSDSTLNTIRVLVPHEREALINHFGKEQSSGEEATLAVSIAEEARNIQAWIKCDCIDSQAAYLYPRLTESGIVTLVRPCSLRQTVHSQYCAFHHTTVILENEKTDKLKKVRGVNFLLLSSPKAESTSTGAGQLITTNDSQKRETTNTISNLTWNLITILDQANVCLLSNDHYPSYKVICDAVRAYALEQRLSLDDDLTLHDVLLVSIKHRFNFFNNLRQSTKFGATQRKQGYILTLVNSIEKNTLHCSGDIECVIEGNIESHHDLTVESGPFIALILCGEIKPGSGYFTYLRASLLPIYSLQLPFPVFSVQTRHLFKQLVSWRMYWSSKSEDYHIRWSLSHDPDVRGIMNLVDPETGNSITVVDESAIDPSNSDEGFTSTVNIVHSPENDVLTFKKSISTGLWGRE